MADRQRASRAPHAKGHNHHTADRGKQAPRKHHNTKAAPKTLRRAEMTREQAKRYHAAKRRRTMRRQRRIFLVCAAAVLLLLFLLVLKMCGFFEKRADKTTLTVGEDGSITFEEVASVDGASDDEVKDFIKDSIRTYNKEKGSRGVRLMRFAEKDGQVYVRSWYKDSSVYADFTGLKCFTGSIAEARKAGYDLSDVYASVEGGKKGATVEIEKALSNAEAKVLILEQNIAVCVPGKINFVTDNATTVEDSIVTIDTGDEKTTASVCVIYEEEQKEEK